MNKTLFMVLSLSLLAGCNWDESSVFGRNPSKLLGSDYDTAAAYCEGYYRLLKESELGVRDCAAPEAVEAVVAEDKGVVVVWVAKLSDGQFPAVANLVYDAYSSNFVLTYACVSGQESADGRLKEIRCTPNTSWRVSPVDLTSRDERLMIRTMVLRNPGCGKTVTLKREKETGDQNFFCPGFSGENDRYTVRFGATQIAPIWVESGVK